MKTISVHYFASFRESTGLESESLTADLRTARELFDKLQHQYGLAEPFGHCKVAINDTMASWDAEIESGDTVLLFPPVAGG